MFCWKKGRQGNYSVLTLFSIWFFDFHIIKIPDGVDVPWHTDSVAGKRHFRINFHINENQRIRYMGENLKSYLSGRIVYFRPDLRLHMVKKHGGYNSNKRPTIILSFGWVRSIA